MDLDRETLLSIIQDCVARTSLKEGKIHIFTQEDIDDYNRIIDRHIPW